MYEVAQDFKAAFVWYRKASDQGHARAQCNLGNTYYHGQGAPQDYKAASVWFRKAAGQGLVEAQFSLEIMFGNG